MESKPRQWTQPALIEGGFGLLSVQLQLHLDGPRNRWGFGWLITATDTGTWVESEVAAGGAGRPGEQQFAWDCVGVYGKALRHLSPF